MDTFIVNKILYEIVQNLNALTLKIFYTRIGSFRCFVHNDQSFKMTYDSCQVSTSIKDSTTSHFDCAS